MKLTKTRLKEIIKEELNEAWGSSYDPKGPVHQVDPRVTAAEDDPWGTKDEEEDFFWPGTEGVPNLSPENVYQNIVNLRKDLSVYQAAINGFMYEYGEFVHVNTYAKMADAALAKLNDKLEGAILRTRESHPDVPQEELEGKD